VKLRISQKPNIAMILFPGSIGSTTPPVLERGQKEETNDQDYCDKVEISHTFIHILCNNL